MASVERELKYQVSPHFDFNAVLKDKVLARFVTKREAMHLVAAYYDSADGMLSSLSGALRMRRENDGESVCTLKLSPEVVGGARVNQEYECEASDVVEGLMSLPDFGAPADVCENLLSSSLLETAHMDFVRDCALYKHPSGILEISYDLGLMRAQGKSADISELEIEFLSGAPQLLSSAGDYFEEKYALTPDPISKYQRARAL